MDNSAAAAAASSHGDGDGSGDAGAQHALSSEEWLASRVLEHVTDVREVCRLVLINKNFWAASLSDSVWQKRIPQKPVLEAMSVPTISPKRDLYIRLCKSVALEDGLKKFWLEPAFGGECYMISARGLTVIWGETPRYWQWKPWPGAVFSEVAYLHTVCWFEIKGTFQQILRPGKYLVSFRMQLHSTQAGWQSSPIKLCIQNTTCSHPPHLSQVHFDKTEFKRRSCPVRSMRKERNCEAFETSSSFQWVECDAGEFVVEDDNEGRLTEIQFSMQEIEVLWWKGGFVLDGVIIRPWYVAAGVINE